ncbi:hypothetical protein [Pseudarthrobacter sp. N5]|uniref:hypothetical protein n=1 Tax=Pseudarthrobacter sp. N5 TaxID=3418416 RepID=UPI003CE9E394
MALNHTNTGADQRKPWARTPALTRTTHGPLKNEYSPGVVFAVLLTEYLVLTLAAAIVRW